MPSELEVFDKLSSTKKIPEADDLLAYYRIHIELCRQYKSEIEYDYLLELMKNNTNKGYVKSFDLIKKDNSR